MLMDENKQLRDELRLKDKELKARNMGQNELFINLESQNKKLLGAVNEKQSEIDKLKKEL